MGEREILYFETSYKHSPLAFWFAIYADRVGKKGTFDFLKKKFSEFEWTWEGTGGAEQSWTFDTEQYSKLKDFVNSKKIDYTLTYNDREIKERGIKGGGYLFPFSWTVKKIFITDPLT